MPATNSAETVSPAAANQPLSELLKSATRAVHEALDQRLMTLQPFANVENYRCFLRMQARLQCVTSPLFHNPQLQAWIADLDQRDRWVAVMRDCADLQIPAEQCEVDRRAATALTIDDPYRALGWLYTVEGSNLGAAFLLKMAKADLGLSEQHGARHMAGAAEGRGLAWRRFKADLDALELTDEQRQQAVTGADEAFAYVQACVDEVFEPATA